MKNLSPIESKFFLNPFALQKLALLLMEIYKFSDKNEQRKPFVLMINEEK